MEITKEALDLFFKSIGVTNNLIYVLISILVLNILATCLRFIFDRSLQNRERFIHKQKLLFEYSIKIQEFIYTKIEKISLYTRDEDKIMLKEIQELQLYVTNNRIYISKSMMKIIESILDYFREVLADFRNKDYKKEQQMFEKYANEFNK
jgi:hypothetical protein